MTLRSRTIVAVMIVSTLAMSLVRPASACGPFFTDAIFVYSKHPDFPLERFGQGQLGVLQPTYARSYLFVAYRTLTGASLSSSELSALKSLWDERLNNAGEPDDSLWIKAWTEARSKVPGLGAPPEIRAFRRREKPHEYESYLNCQEDAFTNAAATLADRVKRLGADSSQVRDWVTAQDTVFANCYEGKHIPEPASSEAEAIAVADRAYQIAAANFYAENYDEAKAAFDQIASDRRSPFHEKASYLAARALVRKGSLVDKEEDGRPFLAEAETRLNTILKDRSLSSMHHAAARLLNLDRVRLHPEEKLHELAHSLLKKDGSEDFKQDVWDYTVLLDKFVGDDEDEPKKVIPPGIKSDELTEWVLTLQESLPQAFAHSSERWQQTRSVAWLVVALTTASANDNGLQGLLDAAQRIDHGSPAFPSVAFHSVRLLIESGRDEVARGMIDGILARDRSALPASALNQFLSQRMQLAQNLDEFLNTAQRIPAGFSDDVDGREIPEDEKEAKETTKGSQFFFDTDATDVLNRAMPVAVLTQAALSRTPAVNLRRDLARAAFMRAALLDVPERAAEIIPVLGNYYPQMKSFLAAYQRADTPEARRFAAIYLALKFPGMRPYLAPGLGRTTELTEIDSFRDNWWCAEPPIPYPAYSDEQTPKKPRSVKPPDFLKSSQPLAARELERLQALGTGPNYLAQTSIDWAKTNPSDPRAPEALHLAVRSTRYGCTDKATGRWSKAAFDLLHARYPNTSWAKQTKYWFKD